MWASGSNPICTCMYSNASVGTISSTRRQLKLTPLPPSSKCSPVVRRSSAALSETARSLYAPAILGSCPEKPSNLNMNPVNPAPGRALKIASQKIRLARGPVWTT